MRATCKLTSMPLRTTVCKASLSMFKRFFIVVIGIFSVTWRAEAQTLMVDKAFDLLKKKDLKTSWEAIQLATRNKETAKDARAWYVRSYVSKELFKDDPQKNSAYGQEALAAVDSCITFDDREKYHKDCKAIASFIYTNYYNQAVTLLNAEKYAEALARLAAIRKDRSDYNAFYPEAQYLSGYAHLMQQQPDSTQHYFSQALAGGFRDPLIYETLAGQYLESGEIGKARTMVDMGGILYADDRGLQIAELNVLMQERQYQKAAQAAERYLSSYKKDTEVMLLYGTIEGKLFDTDTEQREEHFQKRISLYEKILKLEPTNLLANYNLGITYYNKGVELINDESIFEKDIFEFDRLLNVCAGLFQKALPYVLKAHQLDSKNYNTLKALEGIYYNLNEQEKFAQVQAKLSTISSGK